MTDRLSNEMVTVFVNHVDCYSSGIIGKVLAQAKVGATSVDEDDNLSQGSNQDQALTRDQCYQVIGTLKYNTSEKPDWVNSIIQYNNNEDLLPALMQCDFIIYDIVSDPAQVEEAIWAVSALNAEMESFETQKIFICVSTVLTWAKSKPLDPDDPEMPFTEEDYRKRKAHPNFKDHLSCEKLVIKLGKTNKTKLMTYVIASGVAYGEGEKIFHFLFKGAWLGAEQHLKIFGNGQNILPAIHVKDLASVVLNICDAKPKVRYVLAVDDSKSTLEDMVRAISKNLGNGKTKFVSREDALIEKEIEQADFDMLLVNLRMDPTFIKESMTINWVSDVGFVENMPKIIKEFKEKRNLLPIRACIFGPPASGKTTVAKQLCEHYKLHHIKIQDVIDEAIATLKTNAARADEEIEDEDDDMRAQENQKVLDDINECKEKNNGRLEDSFIIKFFTEKLKSMPCQNQGFILDGFPKTMEQAKLLFSLGEDEDDLEEREKEFDYDETLMPEYLISLNTSDDFLRNRVMNLPETAVTGTHNTEEGLHRRLTDFRNTNTEDETVLNYFDELEIHPENLDITQDHTPLMRQTVERIIKIMGKERNYGPTPDELAELERLGIQRAFDERRRVQDELEKQEAEEARDRARKLEEWRTQLNSVKQQEKEMLEAQSIPFRNYLMKNVMPTLTEGLIECCKVRPEDPVDFLAEFLFEKNPQVNLSNI